MTVLNLGKIQEYVSSELELKEMNTSPTQASFLDLSISIADDKYNTSLFDKQDTYALENSLCISYIRNFTIC